METTERDTLEEVYEVKRSISSSFETYEQFAEWLMSEQDAAKKDGLAPGVHGTRSGEGCR